MNHSELKLRKYFFCEFKIEFRKVRLLAFTLNYDMKYLALFLFTAIVLTGCDKMEEPKPLTESSTTDLHSQINEEDRSPELQKTADETYSAYTSDKSDSNKETAIKANLEAGIYFMYDAPLPPREKYRPALKFFRRVLDMDPGNKDAIANKDKIEEIYEMMGMEIPETAL